MSKTWRKKRTRRSIGFRKVEGDAFLEESRDRTQCPKSRHHRWMKFGVVCRDRDLETSMVRCFHCGMTKHSQRPIRELV